MTDPQDPPKPDRTRLPTQQLAALVEEVAEDALAEGEVSADGGEGEGAEGEGDVGEGYEGDAGPSLPAGPMVPSKAPPLLPKEKKQVRTRAVMIAVVVFVVCTVAALGAVVVFGGHGAQPQVARPTPRPPAAPPTATPEAPPVAPHPHTKIQLDEFVFTAGTDAGTPPASP